MTDRSDSRPPSVPPGGLVRIPPSRTIEEMRSPLLRQLHDYWRGKCGARAMPARADLAPDEIIRLLPHLILVDVEMSPFRLYYRLVGTAVQAGNRRNATGQYLDQLGFATEPEIAATYRQVVERRDPYYFGRANLASRLGDPVIFEYGIWPLSDDGHRVNKCLAMEIYLGLRRHVVPDDLMFEQALPVAGTALT